MKRTLLRGLKTRLLLLPVEASSLVDAELQRGMVVRFFRR